MTAPFALPVAPIERVEQVRPLGSFSRVSASLSPKAERSPKHLPAHVPPPRFTAAPSCSVLPGPMPMRTITRTYVLLLLCASGCSFLDDLDRSIEQRAEALTKSVTEPAPATTPAPPAPEPTPPAAPVVVPPPEPEPEATASPLGPPRVTFGKVDVHGALPEKDVRRIMERHKNELRFCYEQTLAGDSVVVLKLVLSPTGSVQVASVASSDSGIEKLDMCLTHAMRRWTFPAPKGGGIAVVTAAIELTRQEKP